MVSLGRATSWWEVARFLYTCTLNRGISDRKIFDRKWEGESARWERALAGLEFRFTFLPQTFRRICSLRFFCFLIFLSKSRGLSLQLRIFILPGQLPVKSGEAHSEQQRGLLLVPAALLQGSVQMGLLLFSHEGPQR